MTPFRSLLSKQTPTDFPSAVAGAAFAFHPWCISAVASSFLLLLLLVPLCFVHRFGILQHTPDIKEKRPHRKKHKTGRYEGKRSSTHSNNRSIKKIGYLFVEERRERRPLASRLPAAPSMLLVLEVSQPRRGVMADLLLWGNLVLPLMHRAQYQGYLLELLHLLFSALCLSIEYRRPGGPEGTQTAHEGSDPLSPRPPSLKSRSCLYWARPPTSRQMKAQERP